MTVLEATVRGPYSAVRPIGPAKRRRTWSYLAMALFAAFIIGALGIHGYTMLQWAYAPLAILVGAFLYVISPPHYLSFVWWLFFLSPFVRRVVDYNLGWNWANPINLAPLLAAGISVVSIRLALRKRNEPHFFPLAFIGVGVLFGYLVGLQNAGFISASYAAFNWMMPPLLCYHICCHYEYSREFREILIRTFVWGGLITGTYGMLQYFYLPAWDAVWLINSQIFGQMLSGGLPFPYYVRVFSTMNSPAPFASAMLATIVIVLNSRHWLRWCAAPPVLISLLLSIVRTAWGGLGVAWLYTMLRSQGSTMFRQFLAATCIVVFVLPLLTIDSVWSIVNKRFESLVKLTDDSSYIARSIEYADALKAVSANFAGNGLGATGTATKLNNGGAMGEHGDFDSGLLEIPFNLGWPGGLLYVTGVIWFLFQGLVGSGARGESYRWNTACGGIVVGTLSECFLTNSLTAGVGMIFWCFLGMLLADKGYRAYVAPDTRANAIGT